MDQIREEDRKDLFEGEDWFCNWPEMHRKYLESLRTPLWFWAMEEWRDDFQGAEK